MSAQTDFEHIALCISLPHKQGLKHLLLAYIFSLCYSYFYSFCFIFNRLDPCISSMQKRSKGISTELAGGVLCGLPPPIKAPQLNLGLMPAAKLPLTNYPRKVFSVVYDSDEHIENGDGQSK